MPPIVIQARDIMPPTSRVGKRVCPLLFTRESPTSSMYVCKCGTKRKRSGTSYNNLLTHVQSAHPNAYRTILADNSTAQCELEDYFCTSKSSQLYGWMDLVINSLLPFSFVESPKIRKHVKHESISVNTFMKYLALTTEIVEEKIAVILPDAFALVFDGWSCLLRFQHPTKII